MRASRATAVLTWSYAAGFGLPLVPVGWYVVEKGSLPWFDGLFPMYGGPWWDRYDQETFLVLLGGFGVTLAAASGAAWLVWRGRRGGVPLALALIPVEAVFWYGFALPIPWLMGAARVGCLLAVLRAARAVRAPSA